MARYQIQVAIFDKQFNYGGSDSTVETPWPDPTDDNPGDILHSLGSLLPGVLDHAMVQWRKQVDKKIADDLIKSAEETPNKEGIDGGQ